MPAVARGQVASAAEQVPFGVPKVSRPGVLGTPKSAQKSTVAHPNGSVHEFPLHIVAASNQPPYSCLMRRR